MEGGLLVSIYQASYYEELEEVLVPTHSSRHEACAEVASALGDPCPFGPALDRAHEELGKVVSVGILLLSTIEIKKHSRRANSLSETRKRNFLPHVPRALRNF